MQEPGGGTREREEWVPGPMYVLPGSRHKRRMEDECLRPWSECRRSSEKWVSIRGGSGTPRTEMS